jgi:predicted aldo/keto reductase-like oxidoreductase
MAYLDTDDFDCIAFVDEKTNEVTIKFVGIPNKESAELFINYVMVTLGIDFQPLDNVDRSKMIH